MAEPSFELHLQRMFAEAPPLPDAVVFAARVQRRLDRGWAWRGLLIGVAGVTGGLIAASQFLASGLVGRANAASETTLLRLHAAADALMQRVQGLAPLRTLPFGGEGLWLAAGLVGVGLALLAARLFETL